MHLAQLLDGIVVGEEQQFRDWCVSEAQVLVEGAFGPVMLNEVCEREPVLYAFTKMSVARD